MSARVTRSSARNSIIGISTSTTTKSAGTEKRRQRKNPIDEENNCNDESNANDIHVTPPKQQKTSEKANALSPSTLLHRLSLGEQNPPNENLESLNVPQKATSKISDARKVLNAGETEHLYGREKEINDLNEFLSSNLAQKTSASIYISGQPGEYFLENKTQNSICKCAALKMV